MTLETLNQWKCVGGTQSVYVHDSAATGTRMEFSVFVPPGGAAGRPVLYWLSGLTCTWENFTAKAGAQRYAAEQDVVIVCPDTSPRGDGVPDAADEYDFGKGAGFYVNATQEPWSKHYRMYDYVVEDLPAVIEPMLGVDGGARGIFGHSMGGHGALSLALRHPERYRSVSAFAPIVAPTEVPWGYKALGRYLGPDRAAWAAHDACALIEERGWPGDILVDQGDADNFLEEQLKPQLFAAACTKAGVALELRMQPGYDHSYYFIASFIGDHIAWHAKRLKA
jgi:S-formylglutathione hydrolase